MKAIWKYPVPVQDEFTVEMPSGAEVLSVQVQETQVCMWVLVDPNDVDDAKVKRIFRIYGTGHPIPENISREQFIGTWQHPGLVFHLFEEL